MSLQYCQAAVSLVRKSITIAGRELGPAKRNVMCRAMRAAIQRATWRDGSEQRIREERQSAWQPTQPATTG